MTETSIEHRPQTPKWRLIQPWPVTILAMAIIVALQWFAMAGIDYRAGDPPVSSFTTAGWFVLGSPMVLATSAAFALLPAMLARKSIWLGLLSLAVLMGLLASAINSGLPQNRVAEIIGDDAMNLAVIERLRVSDSMNDGSTVSGILSGPPELMTGIISHRKLIEAPQRPLHQFRRTAEGAALPEFGPVWSGDDSSFYLDVQSQRIYFEHFIGRPDYDGADAP